MTSIQRIFCGFDQPILSWVASDLLKRYSSGDLLDLSSVTVVVPGGRALRRLMELLVVEAERLGSKVGIVPPKIITRGGLIDRFMPRSGPLASEISRQMAWVSAIRGVDTNIVAKLIPDVAPEFLDRAATSLAKRVDSIYIEISSAGLEFKDVAEKGQQIEGFYEEERWEALQEIYLRYREILSESGQECRYAWRAEKCLEGTPIDIPGELCLVGLFELTPQQKLFLDRCRGVINAVVYATENQTAGFDQYGAVVPAYWEKQKLYLANSQISVVEHPRDIAPAALDWVTSIAPEISESDLVIGLGDETLSFFLKGQFDELDFKTRAALGLSALQTEPGFLISTIVRYLESRSFEHLAGLIRHPFILSWLAERLEISADSEGELLAALDNYQPRHLQATTCEPLPSDPSKDALALRVVDTIHELLSPLREDSAVVAEWSKRIFSVLAPFSRALGDSNGELLKTINEILSELSACPVGIKLRGSEALTILIDQLESRASIPDPRESGIELLGWLELAFDDSVALLITGLDEGVVPAVINSDPFLPDSLNRHLGLASNAARFARDMALLSVILSSKKHLKIVSSRRALSGDLVQPSRLLFACDDDVLPQRVEMLRKEGERFKRSSAESYSRREFLVGPPEPLIEPINSMSITSFASYINCPYQFYLERVAKVYPVSDDLVELDALGFGTLAHDVLAAAARDPGFNSSDANIVRDLLFDTLEDFNRRLFSRNSLPAVKIQIDQLKGRLQRMIDWQVVQRRDGWRTFSVERDLSDLNVFVETSGDPMRITGRIDRIDVNDSTGNYMILDYKTSDRGRDKSDICAEKKIEGHEEKQIVWSDLQVPLYLLAGKLLLANEKKAVGFGYINLSAQTYHQIYEPLDVVDIEYKSGITQASAIADLVRKQVFWPPNSRRVMDPERDPYWRLLAGLSEQVEQLAGEEIDV